MSVFHETIAIGSSRSPVSVQMPQHPSPDSKSRFLAFFFLLVPPLESDDGPVTEDQVCFTFRDSGDCKFGARCRFVHVDGDGNVVEAPKQAPPAPRAPAAGKAGN